MHRNGNENTSKIFALSESVLDLLEIRDFLFLQATNYVLILLGSVHNYAETVLRRPTA
jgi:hypothetical protein